MFKMYKMIYNKNVNQYSNVVVYKSQKKMKSIYNLNELLFYYIFFINMKWNSNLVQIYYKKDHNNIIIMKKMPNKY